MAINAFTVVSEFKFDVAGAILGTDKLAKKVDMLDQTVQNALGSVQSLGIGFLASFSGANAGILGILGNAINATDKFRQSQIELANTMVANRSMMNGQLIGFNDALEQSGFIMDEITKKARNFGISPDALVNQTKMFNQFLSAKGLQGMNLENAIELSRVSLKAAPALGVSEDQSLRGIISGVTGQLSANTQFGTRLFAEAGDAIKNLTGISNLKEFNKAKPEKRIQALIAGLDKLAGTADAVSARADTLTSRLLTVKQIFSGVGSILKPLGEVIMPFLKQTLDILINFLKKDGAEIVKSVARFVKGFISGPEEMLMNFMMLDRLSGDIARSAGIVSLIVAMTHMREIFHALSSVPYISKIVGPLSRFYEALLRFPLVGRILQGFMGIFEVGKITSFGGAIKAIVLTFGRMAGLFGVLLIPIIGLSRALNRIKLDGVKWIAENMASLIDMFTSLKRSLEIFFSPIADMISGWEELFYMILGGDAVLESFKSTLSTITSVVKALADTFLDLYSAFKGIIAGIAAVIGSITSGSFSNLGQTFMEAGSDEFMRSVNRYRAPTLDREGEERQNVAPMINNYDVTMNNSFKEVLQPDRIAFTIQDQLQKASQNRRSARGFSSAATQAGSI